MGCTKFATLGEWNSCLNIFGGSSLRDEMCGCRPGTEDEKLPPPNRGDEEFGFQLMPRSITDYGTLEPGYVPPVGPLGPDNPGFQQVVLDPDGRPVVAGEIVDDTLATGVFYAPNKVLAGAIRKLPKQIQTTVATGLPWLFWALVAWWLYRKASK